MTLPIKIAFALDTFTFGGSETETINLIQGADPSVLDFVGIAVKRPLPLPDHEPPSDGSFPPLLVPPPSGRGEVAFPKSERRVWPVRSFAEACQIIWDRSDIVLAWGLPDLQEHLPKVSKSHRPKIVIISKDSGDWAKGWLERLALCTRNFTANSSLAASAYPEPLRRSVKVIHDGFNPTRVEPKISRSAQRKQWGLKPSDKIVGYLGRIEQDKGVTRIVDGVALLPKSWKAVFIGKCRNSRFANELANYCEAKIPGRYLLVPWTHDVGSALHAFDVFGHPSDHEGFSNSLAEAWLAGIPTVYTAGTGSIPDLGRMGIEVPAEATGDQMASALLKAYKNPIVKKAKRTIEENFLLSHYVERWQDYFLHVANATEKPRVLVLLGNLLTGGVSSWFLSLLKHSKKIDFVSLVVTGKKPLAKIELIEQVESHACPTAVANNAQEIKEIITYTRPDAILAWGISNLADLLPDERPPVVLVSHGSKHGRLAEFSQEVVSFADKAERCVAVSNEAATAFTKTTDVRILHNGVEPPRKITRAQARKALGLKPDQIAIGLVGRLSKEKRPELLAEAIDLLPLNYRGVFIGPPHERTTLERLQQLSGKLIFRPLADHHDTYGFYPGLDVVVLPSTGEGFGLSIVEAWAHGIPVVATRVGILKEHPHAVFIDKATPKALADGITKALATANRATIRQAKKAYEEHFTAKHMAERWEELFGELCTA